MTYDLRPARPWLCRCCAAHRQCFFIFRRGGVEQCAALRSHLLSVRLLRDVLWGRPELPTQLPGRSTKNDWPSSNTSLEAIL
jgi:hypothetical protein